MRGLNLGDCFIHLENKLLLISINFIPKARHSCLNKWYTRFSRQSKNGDILFVVWQNHYRIPSWRVKHDPGEKIYPKFLGELGDRPSLFKEVQPRHGSCTQGSVMLGNCTRDSFAQNTLPENLKMDAWKTTFILGRPIFRGYVSFRGGMLKKHLVNLLRFIAPLV